MSSPDADVFLDKDLSLEELLSTGPGRVVERRQALLLLHAFANTRYHPGSWLLTWRFCTG